MDDIDRKIIDLAQADGRASYAEIGAAVGLSVSTVNERLRKLQAQGVLKGWSATVDPHASGRTLLAFIFAELEGPESERRFLGVVEADASVQECHHVTGDWSFLLKVRVAEAADLEALLRRLKGPDRVRTHTVVALSSSKETAFVPFGDAGA